MAMRRRDVRLLMLLLGFAPVGGCLDAEPTPQAEEHPMPEFLASARFPAVSVVTRQETSEVGPVLARAAESLRQAELSLEIGELNGEPHEVLGLVKSVAIAPSSDIVVLDGRLNELRIYGPDGEFRGYVGRTGQGPGEFQIPTGLTLDRERLFVSDEAQRIHRFNRGPSDWEEGGSIGTGMFPLDVCTLPGGDLLALGFSLTQEEALTQFTQEGDAVRAFGTPYETDIIDLRYHFYGGMLVCTERFIAVASSALGEVLVYSPGGDPQRAFRFDDFRGVRVSVFAGGRFELSSTPSTIYSMESGPEGTLVVQVAHRSAASTEEKRPFAELHTYVLDPASGGTLFVGSDLDPYFMGTEDGFVTAVEVPFPRLKVWRFRSADEDSGLLD